jgi:hypothetical protein
LIRSINGCVRWLIDRTFVFPNSGDVRIVVMSCTERCGNVLIVRFRLLVWHKGMKFWTHLCTTKLNIAAADFQFRGPSRFSMLASSCVLTSSTCGTSVEYPNCREFKERGLKFKRTHQPLPRRTNSNNLAAAVGHVSPFHLRKRCVGTGSPLSDDL